MIEDLPDPNIRVIDGDIEALDKAEAKELRGRPEDAILQHALESKIGFKLRIINGKGSSPHLFAVIEPVPCCGAKRPAFVVYHLLDVSQLSFRPRPRCRRDPAHKS